MSQTFLEDIPEFLEIQRSSFLRILDNGLIQALEKINPISPTSQCEYGLLFYPKDYVLVLPETTITEAFLQGKTYGCKIYVPAIVYETQKKLTSNLKKKNLPLSLPQKSVAQRKALLQGAKRGTKLTKKKKFFGSDIPQVLSQNATASFWTKGHKEGQYFLSQRPSSFFGKKSQEQKPQGFVLPKYPLFSSSEGQDLQKGSQTSNHETPREGMYLKSQGKVRKFGNVPDKETFVELLPLFPNYDRSQKNNVGWNKSGTTLNFKTINKKNLIKKFNKLAWLNPIWKEHRHDITIPSTLNTESHRPCFVSVDHKLSWLLPQSKAHKAKVKEESLPLESRNVKVKDSNNLHFLLRKTYKNPKVTDKKQPSKTSGIGVRSRAISWKESFPFSSLVNQNLQLVEDTKTLMSISWPVFCQTTWTRTTQNSFGRPLKTFEKKYIGAKNGSPTASFTQKLVEKDKVKTTKGKKVSLLASKYDHLGFANTSIGSCKSPSSKFWSKIFSFLDGLPKGYSEHAFSNRGSNIKSQKLNLGLVSKTKEKNSTKKPSKETLTVMPQRVNPKGHNPWTKDLTLAYKACLIQPKEPNITQNKKKILYLEINLKLWPTSSVSRRNGDFFKEKLKSVRYTSILASGQTPIEDALSKNNKVLTPSRNRARLQVNAQVPFIHKVHCRSHSWSTVNNDVLENKELKKSVAHASVVTLRSVPLGLTQRDKDYGEGFAQLGLPLLTQSFGLPSVGSGKTIQGQASKVDLKGPDATQSGLYLKKNFIRLAIPCGTVSPLTKKKEVLITTLSTSVGSEASFLRTTKSQLTTPHNLIFKGFDLKLLKSKIFVLSLGISKSKLFDLRLKGFNKKLKPFGLVLRANFFSSSFDNLEILDEWSKTFENVVFQKNENPIKISKKKGQLNILKLTKKEKNVQRPIKLRLWSPDVFEQPSSLVGLFSKKKEQLIDKNSNFNLSNKAFGSGSKIREIVSSSNQKLTRLKEKPISKKEWVCIGLLPLMTPRGHFIINGSHRIVVSQMSRAPGLYYQTGEKLQATLVPSKGAWLRMSVKVNDNGEVKIWVRITPQRKMPYKIFLETYKYLENYKEQQKEHAPKSKFLNLTYKNINSKIKHFDKHYAIGVISGQINRTLLNMSSYTLGRLGRQRLNERLGICEKKGYITSKDISLIKNNLLKFLDHNNSTNFDDDIDHLENRRVRTCGELLQTEIEVGMTRLKKAIVKQLDDYLNKNWSTFLIKEKQTTTENLINSQNRVESDRASTSKEKKETRKILPQRLEDLNLSRSKGKVFGLPKRRDLCKTKDFALKQGVRAKGEGSTLLPLLAPKGHGLPQRAVLRMAKSKLLAKPRAFSLEARLLGEEIFTKNKKQKNWPHKVGIYFTFIYSKKPIIQTQNSFSVKKLKSRVQNLTFAPSAKEKVKPIRIPEYSSHRLVEQGKEGLKKNQTKLKVGGRDGQWSPSMIVGTKAFAGALREFFGSNPLSQYMDQTNPLAEITHKRRLSSLGPGGVDRASAGIAIRGIHPSHYGRICPIETPEGKNAGLVNSMTMWARINKDGFLETPYIKVKSGSIMSHKANLSPEWSFIPTKKESRGLQTNSQTDSSVFSNTHLTKEDYKLGNLKTEMENNYAYKTKGLKIVALDLKISESSFLPNILLPTRDESERSFGRHKRNVIDFCGVSPTQNISIATSLIPFLEHDDATRALMGSNMQRQAVPLLKAQGPLVRTGLEGKVVGESGHAVQATSSGLISIVTRGSISIDTFISDHPSSVPLIHTIINKPKNSSFGWQKSSSYSSWGSPLYKGILRPGQKLVKGEGMPLLAEHNHSPMVRDFVKNQKAKGKLVGGQLVERCLVALRRSCPKGLRSGTMELKSQGLSVLPKNFWRKSLKISRERKTQILQDYTRSNQATLCVQRPAVKEGRWIQKGDLIGDCSASLNGVLALGQNIVVAYLPMEGFNFEDAIVVSDRLVREELYTSIHIQRVEFDIDALVKKHIPPKIKVKKQKSAYKTIQQDWITWHNPHLLKSEKENLSSLGIIKVGSWVGPGDVLVSKVFPVERKIAPSRHLLLAVFQEKKKKTIDTDDTSLRVPKGIHGRVINVKVVGNGTIIPPNSPFSNTLTEVMVLPQQTTPLEERSISSVPKTQEAPKRTLGKARKGSGGQGDTIPLEPKAQDFSPTNSIGGKLGPKSYASLAQQSNLKLKRNNIEQLSPLTPNLGFGRFAHYASARPKIRLSRLSFYGTKKPWREFIGKLPDRQITASPFSVDIQSAFANLNLAGFSSSDSLRSKDKTFWTSPTNEFSSNYFDNFILKSGIRSKSDLLQDVPQKVFGFSHEKLWLPQQKLVFSENTYEKPKDQVLKVLLTASCNKARLKDSKVSVKSTSRVGEYLEAKNLGRTNSNFVSVKDSQKQEEREKFQKNWAKLWLKIQTFPKSCGSFQSVSILPTLHALSLPSLQNIKSFKVTEPVKQKTQIEKKISRFFSHKGTIGRLYVGLLGSESTRSPWTKNQNLSSLTSSTNFKMLANSDKRALKFRSSIPLTQAEIQTSSFGLQDNKYSSWSENYDKQENSLLFREDFQGQKTFNQKITFAEKENMWTRDSIGSNDEICSIGTRQKFKVVSSSRAKLDSFGLFQGARFLTQSRELTNLSEQAEEAKGLSMPQRAKALAVAQLPKRGVSQRAKAKPQLPQRAKGKSTADAKGRAKGEKIQNQQTNFLNSSTFLENKISSKFKELELEKIQIEGEYKIVQIRVYIAERKKLQVGDKMSGRHGNKGIVSTILPREDMPYLPDGTPVDMVLNPLGIPSRMNVGQVFECLLGLAASVCGEIIGHTPFDEMYGPEASRSLVYLFLYVARLRARTDWLFQPNFPGKTIVFDGRTGTPFEQWVTVGRAYMLKLIHMVDEKIHARSIGPRSLVTQQPVKGRARGGGQRLGEMELWAFEGFGAAYTLQEILTLKSDDIKGRENVENSIIFATTARAHIPETFRMMLFELRCLCLNVELNKNS